MMEDLLYKIALTRIPTVGAVTARTLVSYCGSPAAVFQAKKRELLKIPGIGEQTAVRILATNALKEAEREWQFLQRYGVHPYFYLDEGYPERLRHYHDSPVVLYCKGNPDLNAPRTIGIVGTRQPTAHGLAICEEIVADLNVYNVQIISGLAYGVDVAAHRKCIEIGIPTLGILGHGLHTIYPPAHRSIAEKMCAQAGGLLTEFPHDTKPDRENFPMRNRIIAGLCDALIVIETAEKGGSMITAHLANEYNKDVFAVPGRLRDPLSQGCNRLIKTHKAALLESAADLAYIMRWDGASVEKNIQPRLFVELTNAEEKIVTLLQQSAEMSIDHIMVSAGFSGSQVAALLLDLEFKGLIRALPGKRYTLRQ